MKPSPPLRIIQTGPTTYAVQQQQWRGWLWWRRSVWEPLDRHAASCYLNWWDADELFGGRLLDLPFGTLKEAEEWVIRFRAMQQRELRQYPKVVKELAA